MSYKDPAAQARYQARWAKKHRQEWIAENGPCRFCGSWDRLEVDHIDPTQKVTHAVWSWAPERRDAELAKCQVLCRACHSKKTGEQNRARILGKPGPPRKLTRREVLAIYAAEGQGSRAVAKRFGIHHATVHDIWSGRTWGWLTRGRSQSEAA